MAFPNSNPYGFDVLDVPTGITKNPANSFTLGSWYPSSSLNWGNPINNNNLGVYGIESDLDKYLKAKYSPTSLDWGKFGLEALGGIAGLYMGMKQYNMAKKQMEQNHQAFKKNFNAQAQTLNTSMEDRQRARIASNPNAYESVDSYMNKNRINKV